MGYQEEKDAYEPQSPCLNTLGEFGQKEAFRVWLWNIHTPPVRRKKIRKNHVNLM